MTTSLGLNGEFAEELVHDLAEAFGYSPVFSEARPCETVGDLFEGFAEPLGDDGFDGRCATAICFYRLRGLLQPKLDIELRPKTPINELSGLSVRKICAIIQKDGGMRPFVPNLGFWGTTAYCLLFALPIALLTLSLLDVLSVPGWVFLASMPVAVTIFVLSLVFAATFPPEIKTFGDIVRIVASQNIGKLAEQGARLGRKEAWTVVGDIASKYSMVPRDAISPDMLIFKQQETAAA
ncbi:MAG: hypothetical protein AB7O39_07500 [Flavobacteriaceae bacterium]